MSLQLVFNDTIKTVFASSIPKKLAIALSGGVDSFALAHLLKKFVKEERLDTEIYPITINHNLREASAAEIPVIQRELSKFDLHGNFLTSNLSFPKEFQTKPFEELARLKRYKAINDLCQSKGISDILMGHHFDDQIETFTLRLLSNSGVIGLNCMQPVSKSPHLSHERLNVIRPLLNVHKDQLVKYCLDNNINWVQDHTNFEDITERNIVRNYLVENPTVKKDLEANYKKVQDFNGLIEGKVNVLHNGLQTYGKIDYSNLANASIKVTLSNKQIEQHTDLVLARLFFKMLYPISPSPNYHYSFNKVLDNIAKIRQPGECTFSLLQLQWDVKPSLNDPTVKEITVSRQNVSSADAQNSLDVIVPTGGVTDWLLFDNIYWLKFKKLDTNHHYKVRNLLKDDKINFINEDIIPEDFKYSSYKNTPVLVDEQGKIVMFPTHSTDRETVEWKLKDNAFKFN
ncbi:hypothetical protein WICPIJ_000638 [Wickerhamomyces pijperi]|uniref:tRNA(Ile)-lysidine synthetase n=1 Tax=Wickerhamomyces pijperi TaxID=599730 RepID=A0A9P8TRM6_WICPI|nr:hypothetical protein WICPIJ_000638 [Wickerhamomyces pijperi]